MLRMSRGGIASRRGALTPKSSGPEPKPHASRGARFGAALDGENGVLESNVRNPAIAPGEGTSNATAEAAQAITAHAAHFQFIALMQCAIRARRDRRSPVEERAPALPSKPRSPRARRR